jgi:hypothetical protein
METQSLNQRTRVRKKETNYTATVAGAAGEDGGVAILMRANVPKPKWRVLVC